MSAATTNPPGQGKGLVSERVACAHCGLPAPMPAKAGEPSFCCRGCRGAYELIRGWGLEAFYELRETSGEDVSELPPSRYDDLDDVRLLGHSAPLAMQSATGAPLLKSTLSVSGLHCAACVWLIERAPEKVDGWHSAHVSMRARTADIVFDPRHIRLSQIAQFLHRLGYEVGPLGERTSEAAAFDPERTMLVNIAFAGFCAANAMWIAIALYAGEFTGIAPAHAQFLRWAGVGLGAAAVVFPGRVFFRSALASIATRTPHMDLPLALGLAGGLVASLFALFQPQLEVYFDSMATLVFFLLTGRWLQMRQQRRAGEAVSELIRISPTVATRIDPLGNRSRVPVDELVCGDVVMVQANESIPVDGEVIEGCSMIDRSLLTGESLPVPVTVGAMVEAGTDNIQAKLLVRVTASGSDTKLAAIQQAVADASETRTPMVQLANRIGAWFVIVVIALALVTAVIWWNTGPSLAINHVVALLIVACPCALAMATPLAIAVGIGRLAKREVLVRSGDCLERLSTPGIVYFDKTGTLTEGKMRVSQWFGSDSVLSDVAAMEDTINHPIAKAIVDHAHSNLPEALRQPASHEVRVEHAMGRGISGSVAGRHYLIGSPRLLDEHHVVLAEPIRGALQQVVESGSTPVVVLRSESADTSAVREGCAVLGVQDPIRQDARQAVETLRIKGWQVAILSGDHPCTVNHVAASLGIDPQQALGGLLPEQKLSAIQEATEPPIKHRGAVLMVGDGVNDAAALAAADVGIAVRGGARASLAAAPVVIGHGRLVGVVDLIAGGIRARRTMQRNFAISIGYNLFAVILAMCGWITPLVAAVLMPISSLTVLGLTLAPARSEAASVTTTSTERVRPAGIS